MALHPECSRADPQFRDGQSLPFVTMEIRVRTARGRAIGAELRTWREHAKLEGAEVARRLSWSPTKVSNIEAGRRKASEVDAAMYLACCRAPGDDIQEVLRFFREHQDYWVESHGTKLADELLSLITLETTAAEIHTMEWVLIPGLLQTEDYARLLISSGLTPAHAIDGKVRARKARQVLLRRERPPQCRFFIHENALRLPVGSDAIMNDQLLHLVFASSRPHVRIRVVPSAAGALPFMASGFTLMEYPEAPPAVIAENNVTSTFLEGKANVRPHRDVFERLASVALNETQSRDWLAQRANDHDRPREGHDGYLRAEGPPLA